MDEMRKIRSDILEQFRGKPNIEAICKVLDKHIGDAFAVLNQVKNMTVIETAVGKQLDLIGEIVGLTRAEAGLLCGSNISFDVLDDERYRKYLTYKSFRNSNDCTYYDLINALKIVWGADEIKYVEDKNYPATILITVPAEYSETICDIPPFNPAGVGIAYLYQIYTRIEVSSLHKEFVYGTPVCGVLKCGTYPRIGTVGSSVQNGVSVGISDEAYFTEHILCGTFPEIATLYYGVDGNVVVEQKASEFLVDYAVTGSDGMSGLYPDPATVFSSITAGTNVSKKQDRYKGSYAVSGKSVCGIYY